MEVLGTEDGWAVDPVQPTPMVMRKCQILTLNMRFIKTSSRISASVLENVRFC